MLKRDDPFTPRGGKKVRDNSSLAAGETPVKTPLRNILNSPHSRAASSPRQTDVAEDDALAPVSATAKGNNDEEERRRNRAEIVKKKREDKSALLSPAPEASPRAELPSSVSGTPNMKRRGSGMLSSSLTMEHVQGQSPSLGSRSNLARWSASGSRLNDAPPLSVEQMTRTFEEWMKMAADNKINTKNSWNFALIDYFSELTFLRDGDSINFQKASCTLDGCVKIYASRVDSVVDATTKLLNGLSDKSSGPRPLEDLEEQDEEDNEDSAATQQQSAHSKLRKRAPRNGDTLEKNPENLCLKNFELEFSIDPLFKKTCAEFDEGGSHGTLLHSLEVAPRDNLVIFESSDMIPIDFADASLGDDREEGDDVIDVSALHTRLGSLMLDLDACPISATFQDYTFSSAAPFNMRGTLEKLGKLGEMHRATQRLPTGSGLKHGDQQDNPFDGGVPDMGGDDDHVFVDEEYEDDDYEVENDDDELEAGDEEGESMKRDRKSAAYGGRRSGDLQWKQAGTTDDTGLSYFDGAFKQTWAGPEHWKIRRPRAQQSAPSAYTAVSATLAGESTARRASRPEKTAIDFAASAVDLRNVLAKPPTAASITLGRAVLLERKEQTHLLPDDLHFTSANLLKLFIKPNWRLSGRAAQKQQTTMSTRTTATRPLESFVERDYWIAQDENAGGVFEPLDDDAASSHEDAQDYAAMHDDDGYADMDHLAPEDTQIAPTQTVDFSQQLVSAPRFALAPQLNYARVAKRVDISKLKATLWQEFLDTTAASSATATTATKAASPQKTHPGDGAPPATINTFSNLIHNLSRSYPTDALAEVSVPYCFICLLHLANENNLEIRPVESDLLITN